MAEGIRLVCSIGKRGTATSSAFWPCFGRDTAINAKLLGTGEFAGFGDAPPVVIFKGVFELAAVGSTLAAVVCDDDDTAVLLGTDKPRDPLEESVDGRRYRDVPEVVDAPGGE